MLWRGASHPRQGVRSGSGFPAQARHEPTRCDLAHGIDGFRVRCRGILGLTDEKSELDYAARKRPSARCFGQLVSSARFANRPTTPVSRPGRMAHR